MDIFVCVKQTPDTEATIKVGDGRIQEESVNKWIISPYDEYGIEEALQQKQKHGGVITAISLGPERAADALRSAYALGVDNAIHINDELFNNSDSLVTAKALAEVIKKKGNYDLILVGKQGQDLDNFQTGVILAELLGIPHISVALKLDIDGNKVRAETEIDDGKAVLEAEMPVVVSTQQGLNEPRYPSLKGIMAAKKKEIEKVNASDIGFSADSVGSAGSKVEIISVELPPQRPEGRIIEGESVEDKARELFKALHEDIKVI